METEKLRDLCRWLACIEAIVMWYGLIQKMIQTCQTLPMEDRLPCLEETKRFESMMAHCMCRLVGMYSLENSWWDVLPEANNE